MDSKEELRLRRELAAGVSQGRELEIRRLLGGVGKQESLYEKIPEEVRQPVEGFNVGLANIAGAPVDLANLVLSGVEALTGLDVSSDKPVGGSNWLTDKMNQAGVNAKTEGLLGRVGQEVGENVLPSAGFLKLANTGIKLTGKITQYFEPAVEAVRRAPMAATLADLGIAFTAGGGAYFGERVGGKQGEVYGQMIGGLGGALALSSVVGVAKKFDDVFPISEASKAKKAASMMRGAMSRPGTEAEIVMPTDRPPRYGKPTTGELVNDPGLTGQQRALSRRSAEAAGRSQDREAIQNRSLIEGAERLGGPAPQAVREKTIDFFKERVRRAARKADEHIASALKRAQGKRIDPDEPVDAVSARASKYLNDALKKSRAEERKIWGDVGSADYDVRGVKQIATDIVKGHPKGANPADIHPVIYKLAIKDQIDDVPTGLFDEYGNTISREEIITKSLWKDVESIDEVLALRTQLGEVMRLENAAGRWGRARILRQLMDKLYNGIKPADLSGKAVLDKVDVARTYSKSLNDTFTRGPVGKVMGYEITGDVTTQPEKLLSKLLRPDVDGRLGLDALRATGDPRFGNNAREINAAVDQYVRAAFAAHTIDAEGNFSHAAGLRWLSNRPMMDDPALAGTKALMLDSIQAERMAQNINALTRRRIKAIETKTLAAKYTMGEPAAQVSAALKSDTPTKSMRVLLNAAKKDPTGQAVKGVKGSFYETMLDRISPDRSNVLDTMGNTKIQPKLLRSFIKNYEGAIKETYGETGLKLLREVSRGANMDARLIQGVAAGGGSDTSQNVVTQVRAALGSLGSIIGAKLGFGTHALVAAGTGRRMTLALSNRITGADPENVLLLLEDALYNPDLARDLLLSTRAMSEKAAMNIFSYAAVHQMGHVAHTEGEMLFSQGE